MNMNNDVLKNKWDEFRWNVLNWRNKHRNVQFIKVNSLRERRYGHTREQGINPKGCIGHNDATDRFGSVAFV
jgi:hypothetical protein